MAQEPPDDGPKEREPLTESVFQQRLRAKADARRADAPYRRDVRDARRPPPAVDSGGVPPAGGVRLGLAGFVNLSSRLITGATPLFAVGITLDFYLLVRAVSETTTLAAALAVLILAITVVLWYAVPRVKPLARILRD